MKRVLFVFATAVALTACNSSGSDASNDETADTTQSVEAENAESTTPFGETPVIDEEEAVRAESVESEDGTGEMKTDPAIQEKAEKSEDVQKAKDLFNK